MKTSIFIVNIIIGVIMSTNTQASVVTNIAKITDKDNQKILTSRAVELILPLSSDDQNLISIMEEKLHSLEGVGLAAPQVSSAKRIISIYIPESAGLFRDNVNQYYPMHTLINPSYTGIIEGGYSVDFESCYSVPDLAGYISRFNKIKYSYQDLEGNWYKDLIAEGFYARVLQHEIDHLDGILWTDRLKAGDKQGTLKDMLEIKRNSLSDEKKQLFDDLLAKKNK